jgi:hypothetical protein
MLIPAAIGGICTMSGAKGRSYTLLTALGNNKNIGEKSLLGSGIESGRQNPPTSRSTTELFQLTCSVRPEWSSSECELDDLMYLSRAIESET